MRSLSLSASLLTLAAIGLLIPSCAKKQALYDGSSLSGWQHRGGQPAGWKLLPDGSMEVTPRSGDLVTHDHFGDHRLHLEFRVPEMPEAQGQAKGNSGVYLHGRYEVQVLDSYGLEPLIDGCGAIYGIAPPSENASRPAGEWQSYDIDFRAPRFDDEGGVVENPRITVRHNGVTIHEDLEIPRPTRAGMADDMVPRGPLLLQDHGNLVRYRNIWVEARD